MSRHFPKLGSATFMLLLAAGCGDQGTMPSAPSPLLAPSSATNTVITYPPSGQWAAIVDGERGTTSKYRLYMPRNWNHELVVYAHGIVAPFFPVALPVEGDGMASIFGAQGFAVALSSYDETGLAIRDGVKRTHEMRGLFRKQFDDPSRTYLTGSSMGGFIVARLAEEHGGEYDGVMPICGVVGGFPSELRYVLNARVLFDYLYPGVLPGTPYAVPMPHDSIGGLMEVARIQGLAATALGTNGLPALQLAITDQSSMPLPQPYGSLTPNQFGEFVITPQLLHAIFINDVVMRTKGNFPLSNIGVTYTSSSFLAPYITPAPFYDVLNATIVRVRAEQAGARWVEKYGDTSGELQMPTLTLHTRYDTWVPIEQETIYRGKVAARNRSPLLVQRTTAGFGHCTFTPGEIAQGLADLTAWVERGVKPAP
jgi:pimeloyl-ACP methyl ester carboxylesterase